MNGTVKASKHEDTPSNLALSLSEISSLVNRAARGATFEWGEADEAAFAATWLSKAGIDWVIPILKIFSNKHLAAPLPAIGTWTAGNTLCPIRSGIALADFADLEEGPLKQPITLTAVQQPILLLPFASTVANKLERSILVSFSGDEYLVTPNAPPTSIKRISLKNCADIVISCAKSKDEAAQWPSDHFNAISQQSYQRLSDLALRTTVPTSAKSQAGAGASSNDND